MIKYFEYFLLVSVDQRIENEVMLHDAHVDNRDSDSNDADSDDTGGFI